MNPTVDPGRGRWRWNERLRVAHRREEGKPVVVLHDPSTEDYYRLGLEEYEIARTFDGGLDLDGVLEACGQRAAGLDRAALAGFAEQLVEAGLLLPSQVPTGPSVAGSTAPAVGSPAAPAVDPSAAPSIEAPARPDVPAPGPHRGGMRLLRFQIAAFDAGRFFERTVRWVRPLFARPVLVVAAGAAALAAYVAATQAGAIRDDLQTLLLDIHLAWLWVVFAVIVVLHELAHGYTCAHFGGRVGTLGFLVLYGRPCAYCDVSDSWLLSKSQRLWIMSAGSLLEIVLWALATLVWRVAAPETLLHHGALLVLAICGASSLLNFNPLIQFDGYYMLSDGLEIPNLRQRAFADLRRRMLGRPAGTDSPRERRIFLAYGVVAVAYTAVLLGVVLVALHRFVGTRWGGSGLVVLWGAIAVLSRGPMRAFGSEVAAVLGAKRSRRLVWAGAALALGGVLVFVRWPLKVGADCRIEPRARVVLRSPIAGTVESVPVVEGGIVRAGDLLVQLTTREVDFTLAAARADEEELSARLALLESGPRRQEIELAQRRAAEAATRVRFRNLEHNRAVASLEGGLVTKQSVEDAERELRLAEEEEAAARKSLEIVAAGARPEEVRAMRARLDAVRAQVARLEDERARTRIPAAIAGQVLSSHPERLVGRFVERGDSLLVLADLGAMLLEIPVPEKEVDDVPVGAPVRFKSRSQPGRTFEGRVVEIAPAAETVGRQRTVFVRSEIDNHDGQLRAGTTGYAKIYCGERPLGSLLARRGLRSLRTEFWALW